MWTTTKTISGFLILAAWIWGAVYAWHSGEWLVTVAIAGLFVLGLAILWHQLRRPNHTAGSGH